MTISILKNIPQKLSAFFGLFLLAIFFKIAPAQAYNFTNESGLLTTGSSAGYGGTPKTPEDVIGNVIMIVLGLVGVAFLGFMIYAGITWMTAQGNDQKVQKAKDTITESIVGLIIVIAAYGITSFITRYFSTTTLK